MPANNRLNTLLDRMRDLPEFVGIDLTRVDQHGNFGNSPLHVAVTWGDTDAIVTLIEEGADVNVHGEEGMTPLHRAAALGNAPAVEILLRLGANPNATEKDGTRPIDLASALGRKSVVDILSKFEVQGQHGKV